MQLIKVYYMYKASLYFQFNNSEFEQLLHTPRYNKLLF